MSLRVQLILIIGSFLFFRYILVNIRRSKLTTDMATIWILWGIGIILIAIFPQIITFVSSLLGIYGETNTVYVILIFFLYVLSFLLYIKISVIEDRLKNIIHDVAILEKELDEKEKQINEKINDKVE